MHIHIEAFFPFALLSQCKDAMFTLSFCISPVTFDKTPGLSLYARISVLYYPLRFTQKSLIFVISISPAPIEFPDNFRFKSPSSIKSTAFGCLL